MWTASWGTALAAGLAAHAALRASAAHAQEIQLTGPLSGAVARPHPRDPDEKLFQPGVQGGFLSRLPIGPGVGHESTLVPFVGAEARLSFPWPYPGGADLSHGVAASVDFGQGRSATNNARDERVLLVDATYFMAYPLRGYGSYSILAAARTGPSVMALWPIGEGSTTRFAGGLVGAEFALQLMDPALRLGVAWDLRALWQLERTLGTIFETSLGLRAGWAFVL